jgi:hypothetical protein
LIEPNWILAFSKKRGRWWVRLLACGRYHHIKAVAYLPSVRAWLFYDVKFNGTRLMLAHEDDGSTDAFLHDYLDNCDLIAMPRLQTPERVAPHPGFWCTVAMKHLVGIRTAALRPDRLWHHCIAAGGKPLGSLVSAISRAAVASASPAAAHMQTPSLDRALAMIKTYAQMQPFNAVERQTCMDAIALGRCRGELIRALWDRMNSLQRSARMNGLLLR